MGLAISTSPCTTDAQCQSATNNSSAYCSQQSGTGLGYNICVIPQQISLCTNTICVADCVGQRYPSGYCDTVNGQNVCVCTGTKMQTFVCVPIKTWPHWSCHEQ